VPEKFQGRRREAKDLFERVLKNRVVNVVGEAGIGRYRESYSSFLTICR
jgi:hypothetical protein